MTDARRAVQNYVILERLDALRAETEKRLDAMQAYNREQFTRIEEHFARLNGQVAHNAERITDLAHRRDLDQRDAAADRTRIGAIEAAQATVCKEFEQFEDRMQRRFVYVTLALLLGGALGTAGVQTVLPYLVHILAP